MGLGKTITICTTVWACCFLLFLTALSFKDASYTFEVEIDNNTREAIESLNTTFGQDYTHAFNQTMNTNQNLIDCKNDLIQEKENKINALKTWNSDAYLIHEYCMQANDGNWWCK